jgi:hypothetical protein
MYKSELSDNLGIKMKREQDPHPVYVDVMQIPQGKMNKGKMLCGRCARHKDVRRCGVGLKAFYLGYKLHLTRGFSSKNVSPADVLDNSKLFNQKLLTTEKCHDKSDLESEMSDNSYSTAMKSVLEKLKIPSSHWLHIGRVLGPKFLEQLELEADEIRRLGNWAQTVQELCYSGKIPMRAIRLAAGHKHGYYNPRTVVMDGLDNLIAQSPFAFVKEALEFLLASEGGDERYTALCFFNYIDHLAMVMFQDAAAFWVLYPERKVSVIALCIFIALFFYL